MRTIALTLLSTLAALPLCGQAGPVISPSEVTIRVGESVTLQGWEHPGGLSAGFPYRYEFYSDTPGIATINGFASGSAPLHPDPIGGNGDIYVTGIAPGIAHARVVSLQAERATVLVLPAIRPVEIHTDAARVLRGQRIALTAVVPGFDQPATYTWYRGRIGDGSRLIQGASGANLAFIAEEIGVSYVWVRALAGSISSSAEIGIQVVQPRGRAVRH